MSILKVVLWGAGNDCERNISILPPDWQKIAIVDSSKDKIGKTISGLPVVSKDDLLSIEFDYIVITSSKYTEEIKDDIRKAGISMLRVIDGARCNKVLTQEEHCEYYEKFIAKKDAQLSSEYVFENRKEDKAKLLYILAGYKLELWQDVSNRLKKYLPNDIDVCILSSGKYVEQLSKCAEENGWSYLSTSVNDVAIIQNIVIKLFEKATYIYKMDEDIFITRDCFVKMYGALLKAQNDGVEVGFVGPIIPLHTNGHLFLKQFSLEEEYKKRIGVRCVPGGRWTNRGYATNPRIPEFLWSAGNIDELNKLIEKNGNKYIITPIKYAICFILFERKLYEDMGGFNVVPETRSAGVNGDEGQIMEYCMHHCKCTIVAGNTLCGHFSYPDQEREMMRFKKENASLFELRD